MHIPYLLKEAPYHLQASGCHESLNGDLKFAMDTNNLWEEARVCKPCSIGAPFSESQIQ